MDITTQNFINPNKNITFQYTCGNWVHITNCTSISTMHTYVMEENLAEQLLPIQSFPIGIVYIAAVLTACPIPIHSKYF